MIRMTNHMTNVDDMAQYLELLHMVQAHVQLEQTYWGQYCLAVDPSPRKLHTASEIIAADRRPCESDARMSSAKADDISGVQTGGQSLEPGDENAHRIKKMAELSKHAASCIRCRLSERRTRVVFGSGDINARLVVVGEAPGFYEDKEGVPFVGDAGQLLTKMLAAINLSREQVYICNVIKCRPPNNRKPQPDEIDACRYWFTQQLELLRPKIICAMGKFASHALTGVLQNMVDYRGKIYDYNGIPVICTYHPSYLLRNEWEKKKAWQDLKKIGEFLDKEL